MNLGTSKDPVKVLLDTNILISAIGFGGGPRKVFLLALQKKIQGVTSPILLAEFREVISKKFPKLIHHLTRIEKGIKKSFIIVQPEMTINILKDTDDNRVLEAAVDGKCEYIFTGDKELLELDTFRGIKILPVARFLSSLGYKQV
ncbi:MAG: putative toxin-antitoxin system toxin component, PIN family [bacterium]|nr:putative toxin-antitoxin system toxin component, PIN family [bacterium]